MLRRTYGVKVAMADNTSTQFSSEMIPILLKAKGQNVNRIIQAEMAKIKQLAQTFESAVHNISATQVTLQDKEKKFLDTLHKAKEDASKKADEIILNYENKLKEQQFKKNNLSQQNEQNSSEVQQIINDNIETLTQKIKNITDKKQENEDEFIKKENEFNESHNKEYRQLESDKSEKEQIIEKANHFHLQLDKLYQVANKNPKNLFNDNVSHDLILFAHKDEEFKKLMESFLNYLLEEKDFQFGFNKVGKIQEEIYTKTKGITVFELISIYSKLIHNVLEHGVGILDKSLMRIFIDADVERAIKNYRDDISLPEILQIAKLDREVHKKVLVHTICIDFYISFLRAEVKKAKETNTKFVMPEFHWDALIYLTQKWPFFFRRFGKSLNTFEDLQYIKLFHKCTEYTSEIIKNPKSEEILEIIIKMRNEAKDTFNNNFKTADYILLLHDTVAIAKTNTLRCVPNHEVITIRDQLNPSLQPLFLKLFNSFDVKQMLSQEEFLTKEEREILFLRFEEKYLSNDDLLQTLQLKTYDEIPKIIRNFLQTLHVDVTTHYENIKLVLSNLALLHKNISMSVISSEKQLPIANTLYQSLLKCAQCVDTPKALVKLVITKEIDAVLHRKSNNSEDIPNLN